MNRLCKVCQERPITDHLMCEPCGKSYDRYAFDTGSIADVIIWAAKRARRFERKRARAAKWTRGSGGGGGASASGTAGGRKR